MSDVFYKEYDNGLRLVFKPMRALRSLSVGVWVGAGSVYETEKNNGISHFIEHMLFKGTEKRSAFEIADAIDRVGAQINAFTAKECTCFFTKSVDEHAETCMEVLSDLFFNSVFDKKEIEKEQSVVCEEISMVEDTPEDVCHELLAAAMFHGHSLGRTILGPAENVRIFDAKTMRGYMGTHYSAKNTVIAIAGNLSEEDADALTRQYFADKFKNLDGVPEPSCAPAHNNLFYCKEKKIEQANIAVAFPSFAFNSENTYALMLFNNIFGASMSGRLFQKVREELGLAYSIYSFPSAYKNCGMFSVFCGTNPQNTEKAVLAVRAEIDKLVAGGITEDEFLRGREQMKGNFILGQESTSSVMNALGKTMLLAGEVFDLDERVSKIKSVTKEAAESTLRAIFDMSKACASYVAADEKDILSIFMG